MNGTRELETRRLHLRRYRMEDAALLHQYFGTDEKMYEYSGWNPYATKEMAEGSVRRFIDSYDDPSFYGWAIELKEDPFQGGKEEGDSSLKDKPAAAFAGTVGAYDYDPESGSIEIGLSVRRDLWGKGIAGESLRAVLQYLSRVEKIPHLKAWCASENIGSQKAMEKAGMHLTSVGTGALQVGDAVYDKLDYEYSDEGTFPAKNSDLEETFVPANGAGTSNASNTLNASSTSNASNACDPVDLTFRMDCGTFNYRVGAVIIHDGKLLLMHNEEEPYFYTVGGRVHFNETTEETVVREVREEIGVELEIERFLFFQEQFFDGKVTGTHIHELGVYYLMKDSPALENLECSSVTARGVAEELHWIPLEALDRYYIVPESVAAKLRDLPAHPEHIIEIDER